MRIFISALPTFIVRYPVTQPAPAPAAIWRIVFILHDFMFFNMNDQQIQSAFSVEVLTLTCLELRAAFMHDHFPCCGAGFLERSFRAFFSAPVTPSEELPLPARI